VILNKLIVNVENMPVELLELFSKYFYKNCSSYNTLESLVKEDGFLQHDYFSLFEINRTKFGPFGTIHEMTPQRTKLIIEGIFLIRVLISSFIMRPCCACLSQ